jgi:ATP-dependent helicase/nuclease subunit A
MGVLKQSWQLRGRKPLRQWIESAWHDIGGMAVLASSDQYDNAQQYFDLLESLDSDTEGFSLTRLTTKLQSLYAKSVQSTDNPVQIMTIHKSKGLEFDTVILPAIDRPSASDSKTLLFWNEHLYTDGDTGLVLCPLDATGDESPLYKFLAAEQKRAVSLEYTRLLYVAATRAKKRLHLIANGEVSDDGVVKAPTKNSLLAKIWPSVKDQLSIEVSTEQQTANEKQTPRISTLKRLPADFALTPTNDAAVVGSTDADALETQEEDESKDSNTAKITGIVIHEILQAIASSDLTIWDNAKIASLQMPWRMRLINSGIDQAELEHALAATTAAVSNSLNDDQGRWLLDSAHSDSVCEWPLTFNSGNILYHYVIDRSFVVDGERWIIDYKSAQPTKGQSQKEFIKQQVAQYSEQLARYTQACQALDGLPVRTALYFPSIPCLHELPPSLF